MKSLITSPRMQLKWADERMVPGVDGDSKLEHLHRYALAVDLAAGKDVLDVACGEGYGAMLLAAKARSVLGVDNSAEIIEHAEKQYRAANLRFQVALAQELPLADESVDLVVSFETIQYIIDQEKFFSEVKRVLRPGGQFLLSSPNKAVHRDDEKELYLKELSQEELQDLIGGTFLHQQWLAQRVCYGSIAYGLNGAQAPRLHSYDGDFGNVRSREEFAPPPSFLALCSDEPLGPLPGSVFENSAALDRLRNAASIVEQPLTQRIRELEVRISRMETSTWWRLRKPIKLITDLLLRRPATGLFTPPPAPSKTGSNLPGRMWRALESDTSRAGSLLTANQELPAVPTGQIAKDIAVVIPVYNNYEEVQLCLASVLRYTSAKHKIIVIDDASTDVRMWPMLQRMAAEFSQVNIHRNSINRGYVATVNRGLNLCKGDVVVIHSDVCVSQKWLHKLASAAVKFPRVATVSPLINRAGPFGISLRFTESGGPPPQGVADVADVVERMSPKALPRVPVANPACVYIRREALDQCGVFDEVNFPNGFGEEADFSGRATDAEFIHLIEDSTFVFKKRSASRERRSQMSQAGTLGRDKQPAVQPAIADRIAKFLAADPLVKVRGAIRDELVLRADNLQKIYRKEVRRRRENALLYVVQEGTGGTVLTAEDLIRSVSGSHACYLLRTSFQQWSFYRCDGGEFHLLRRFQFDKPWAIDDEIDEQRSEALAELLEDFRFAVVHIRHLLGNAPEMIAKFKESGAAVVFSFHDFYTVCPNIQLIDNHQHFCAGRCSRDTNGSGNGNGNGNGNNGNGSANGNGNGCADCKIPSIWPLMTLAQPLKHHYVLDWRKRIRQTLELCDGFVTTSKFSTQILMQHFDFLRRKDVRIIEHGRDFSGFRPVGTPPTEKTVKVVYFGALQTFKGADLLAEIMRLDRGGKKRFEFHILGSIARNAADPRRLGGIYHGRYKREQLTGLIEAIQPSFAIIPSIWPETFCHTLTEAWAMGLPVFASDLGALRERIQTEGGGWLIDPHSPQKWYETMLSISSNLTEYDSQIRLIQQRPLKTTRQMAAEYIDLYDSVVAEVGK